MRAHVFMRLVAGGLVALVLHPAAAELPVLPLWPEGVPDLQTGLVEVPEQHFYRHVQSPTLTRHAPDVRHSTGAAIIYAPGGDYERVGDGQQEAQWLNALGITVFVLKHRLADYGHPAPLQDILRAVRIVRSRADEFGIMPHRIGVMGTAAGGHLAACAATLWSSPAGKTGHALDQVDARPNFAVLLQPLITLTDPFTHPGSRHALLGASPTPAQIQLLSLENQVRSNTPPVFLVATLADARVPVENALTFYAALRRAGVPAEMHDYTAGTPGARLTPQDGPFAKWPERCAEWMRFNRWIVPEHRNFGIWDKEMAAFAAQDKTNPPPQHGILFTGSSTIRLWESLARDFPGLPVINRGFGGSEIEDVTHFAARIIFPYAPRQIIFRSGGNDLQAGKSPESTCQDFKDFVATVHARLPDTEIVFLAWNNSPSRWHSAARERALNELVAAYAQTQPKVKYLDVFDFTFDANGRIRGELFRNDRLHFNAAGYKLLAELVRPVLMR
ncbi:MAG TPA: GDSL-type esterase/lipase family protein [Verrucomicrobiota bacterium]|nr:GDSL-type esterase/lipase family protein [Verrucomicrobiota bacterium]HNT14700.1 GDSL-type esterase/lipase family protein [Verrucomicrobiota bacterium]